MKRQFTLLLIITIISGNTLMAQEKVKTIFKKGLISVSAYGAATNKLTNIRGDFANLSGIYGGLYVNHRFMIGLAGAATTNNIRVPQQFSTDPNQRRTYEYGQFGLMTEYVVGSNKPIHLVLQGFAGAGFTLQYDRYDFHDGYNDTTDKNWFTVAEPGVQVEMNLFKWMRFSPGVSYRFAFGSDGLGMKDKDISGVAFGATLKFGRF